MRKPAQRATVLALIKGLSFEAWLAKEKPRITDFTKAMQKYRLYK